MLHRNRPLAVACVLLLLAGLFGAVARMPPASASNDCDLVLRPEPGFDVGEPDGRRYEVMVDLDRSTEQDIAVSRSTAGVLLQAQGFSESSKAAVFGYFDSLLAWLRYLAAPCAPAAVYEGPYTNRPPIAGSPYGFGGIEVSIGPPVVMIVTGADGEADVEVARMVEDDGPALAHSGSESFVLAYFGAGLLAFGATALGMRRWMSGPIEDSAS